MTATPAKQEFGGIDILRFLAAVSVALYHYCFFIWAFPQGIAGRVADVPPQPALESFFSWGWIGVEVFFVISGFVIAFSAENSSPRKFAIARFKRLLPAVLICAPITAALLFAMDVYSARSALSLTVRTIAFFPVTPWVDSVYWTLAIEIAFYALVWGLLLAGRIRWLESLAIGIGLLSSGFWAFLFLMKLEGLAATRALDLLLAHHGCFFAFGVLLWAIRTRGVNGKRIIFATLFALAGTLQIDGAANTLSQKVETEVSAAAPILIYLLAIALITASLWARLSWVGWRKIGLATYPLYLIHNAVGAVLIGKLQETGMPYLACALITLLVVIGFSCLIAWHLEPVLRAWIDRLPFMPRRAASPP